MAVQTNQEIPRTNTAPWGRESRTTASSTLLVFRNASQNLFRAGHVHANVMLVLSLVVLRYVDEARSSNRWKQLVRNGVPSASVLLPAGFFFSILSPVATAPNHLIHLSFAGVVVLAVSVVTLGVDLPGGRPVSP